jgi:hypothetical protein
MLVLAVAVPWRCAAAARQRSIDWNAYRTTGCPISILTSKWFEGDRYETLADLPLALAHHDPASDPRGEAASGGLVSGNLYPSVTNLAFCLGII